MLTVQAAMHQGKTVSLARPTRWLAWVAATAVVLQLAMGGWVSTNYAVLACQDFPTCQGGWWPRMNFSDAFVLNRPLGRTADPNRYLPFEALTAIHVTHRALAVVVVALCLALAWQLRAEPDRRVRGASQALVALLGWQVLTGVSNVVLGWPIAAAVAHVAGACGLVMLFAVLLTRHAKGLPRHAP